MTDNIYDVVIIGAGPAGLSAGIYCGRYMLKTVIIEKAAVGGQITLTSEIENYPGCFGETAESGAALTYRMKLQAEHFGAEFISGDVAKISVKPDNADNAADEKSDKSTELKELTLSDGTRLKTKAVIIAGGAHHRPIGCKNEEKYIGCGISYCAVCDANFFAGLNVYVIGGGEAAIEEAMHLAKIARHVTVIHRRDSLRASKHTQQKAFSEPKISFMWDSVVEEAFGEDILTGIKIRNLKTGEAADINADEDDGMIGLFGFTGMEPETEIYKGCGIELDAETGYIRAGEDTHTNVSGIFAAGDIRTKSLRQVVTACADGAVAASEADKYLAN